MSFKIFLTAFITIFLAELFDKTELAVLSLAMKETSKWSVLLGAMCAFLLATVLAVFLGGFISQFINPRMLRYGSAVVFFGAGILILLGKI
jgi:putative Ca2+/H+ antiporter (TMEM165/GDT1 family)